MKIYPVVHMDSPDQALTLSKQAFGAGADGVFLIDHRTFHHPEVLTDVYREIREALGGTAWLGVNYLNLSPAQAVRHLDMSMTTKAIDNLPNGLWTDDATTEAHIHNVPALKHVYGMDNIEYFGGIAFKYQLNYTDDPVEAAAQAREFIDDVDVVTTSGAGTGYSADVSKVAAMKAAIGNKPLALASGVDIHNIDHYREAGLDMALVASSIETAKYSGKFDLRKMHDLIQQAHDD